MLPSSSASRPRSIEDLTDAGLYAKLDRVDLASRKIFAGKLQGERRSKRRGQSVEFDDYRNYSPGDDLRFIDWNVYARFEKFFIKLFLEEEDLALHIALDASASMNTGDPSKLVFGARLALALAYVGFAKNNRVGMSVFGVPWSPTAATGPAGPLALLPDRRGRRHFSPAAAFLLEAAWPGARDDVAGRPATGSDLNSALTTIARVRTGKGVVVVISDFLDPGGYERGLRSLGAIGGFDTYCLQVLSPGEIDPAVEVDRGLAGDVRLADIESGRSAQVTITPALIKRYRERLARFNDELHTFCVARAMSHIVLPSDADLAGVTFDALRRHGVLR